jgi:methylenetetrahydrofolate dehydrogenase (NADP+) / methenyltetrahydrofolate cyclohydrolase
MMPESGRQAKEAAAETVTAAVTETITKAKLMEGGALAEEIKRRVASRVEQLVRERDVRPCLAVVRVGEDPASAIYVRNKVKASEELGLRSEHHALGVETTTEELLGLVSQLNMREEVDGILVQLPLPAGIDEMRVLEAVDPAKLLLYNRVEIRGANACVVGRSRIVGRPLAQLLLQRDATVTICHSRTRDLASVTSQADILVAAIGRPGFIRAEHIKPGATVIDVGINRVSDEGEARQLFGEAADKRIEVIGKRGYTIVGDVHPSEALRVAGHLTPVPGGVGLLTVAMLMQNTLTAATRRRGLE